MQTRLKPIHWLLFFIATSALRVLSFLAGFSILPALALFSTCFFGRNFKAYVWILLLLLSSDWVLNSLAMGHPMPFYPGFYWQYIGVAAVVMMGGFFLKTRSWLHTVLAAITSSLVFFFISNFGVWMEGLMYPMNFHGLSTCLWMGVPFLKTMLSSTLVYATLFHVGLQWMEKVIAHSPIACSRKAQL